MNERINKTNMDLTKPSAEENKIQKLNVLLIEDNPGDARLIKEMINQVIGIKINIDWTDKLSIGIKKIAQNKVDAILLDLSLPDSNGLITFISLSDRSSNIPIIVITGLEDQLVSIEAMKSGAQDYLIKDKIDTHLLKKTILHAIERKKIEIEIRKSEEKYRNLYDTALVGMFKLEARTLKVIQSNKTFLEILGYKLEDGKKKSEILAIINPFIKIKDSKKLNSFISNMEKYYQVNNCEMVLLSSNGLSINVLINAKYYEIDDTIEGTIIDITKLKNIEKELIIAKNKAEETDKLKIYFLSKMSHELKTPLNSVLGYAQLLDIQKLKESDVKNYSKKILEAGNHLLDLINSLIDMSSLVSEKTQVDKKEINLPLLIHDVYKQTIAKTSDKNINFKVFIQDNIPFSVRTDPVRLSQILTNLLDNAVKFTNHGIISIDVNKSDENSVIFSVKDTGIGIPDNKQDIVFDSFLQANNSFSRSYGGAGLGLSIAKYLVELLGGKIWLTSSKDKGTTIFFTIKICEQSLNTDMTSLNKDVINDLNNNQNIVLIDNDEVSIPFMKLIAKELKYNLIVINDYENNLDNNDIIKTDLVILGSSLFPNDSDKVINLIKSINKINKVPLIALLSNSEIDKDLIDDLQIDDYLTKPLDVITSAKILKYHLKDKKDTSKLLNETLQDDNINLIAI